MFAFGKSLFQSLCFSLAFSEKCGKSCCLYFDFGKLAHSFALIFLGRKHCRFKDLVFLLACNKRFAELRFFFKQILYSVFAGAKLSGKLALANLTCGKLSCDFFFLGFRFSKLIGKRFLLAYSLRKLGLHFRIAFAKSQNFFFCRVKSFVALQNGYFCFFKSGFRKSKLIRCSFLCRFGCFLFLLFFFCRFYKLLILNFCFCHVGVGFLKLTLAIGKIFSGFFCFKLILRRFFHNTIKLGFHALQFLLCFSGAFLCRLDRCFCAFRNRCYICVYVFLVIAAESVPEYSFIFCHIKIPPMDNF